MGRFLWDGLLVLFVWLVSSVPIQAGFMYQLADSSGTPTTSFTISSIGGTVDVKVYLKEDVGGALLSTEELFSASAKITYGVPSGIAAVSSLSDIMPNSGFVNWVPAPSFGPTEAGFTGDVGVLDPYLIPDGDNRIFLGTFRFTGLSVGTVAIAVMDRDTSSDDTISGLGNKWDSAIAGDLGSITVLGSGVEAVPEPTSLSLLGLGGLGLAAWRWRGRRRKAGAACEEIMETAANS